MMMLQLEDILLFVELLQLQSTLLSGQTRLCCFLFAHESGAARRLRDSNTRQSGFLQQKERKEKFILLIRSKHKYNLKLVIESVNFLLKLKD